MSILRSTGDELVVFFSSSISVVLFDNPGISKCFNTLVLLKIHLCFNIGFICDLFVVRNDVWMSKKNSTRTEQIYSVFTTMEAEGKG